MITVMRSPRKTTEMNVTLGMEWANSIAEIQQESVNREISFGVKRKLLE